MSVSRYRSQDSALQECPHFFKRKCGGCSFLHVPYQDQLSAKQKKVAAILASTFRALPPSKRPDLEGVMRGIVPSPNPLGYRASAKFMLHEDKSGRKTIGLYAQGTRSVVSTSGCPANTKGVNDLVQKMFAGIEQTGLRFFDHGSKVFQKNSLKYLTVRTGPSPDFAAAQAAVIVSHTGVDKQALAKWLAEAGLSQLAAFESRLAKEDGEALTGRTTTHVSGPEVFSYLLTNRTFHISPVSFFQANHGLAADLIGYATDFSQGGDILLDLYGGFGAYSFAVKDRFKEVIVVDGNAAAIQAANAHAREHGVSHLKAHSDTCENFLRQLAGQTAGRISHLIVNPSRTGMSAEVLKEVTSDAFRQLRELHYISCSPPTFARDALSLIESGFKLREVVPFDMFPQTDHVELAAKFHKG